MANGVTVRRPKLSDVTPITEFIHRVSGNEIPEDEVQEKLFGGFWVAVGKDDEIIGVAGLQVINLVACITDFYTDPPGQEEIGTPLLDELLASAKELECEAAQMYLDTNMPEDLTAFLQKQDFVQTALDEMKSRYWKEIAQDFLGEGQVLMQRKLKDRPTMRPM